MSIGPTDQNIKHHLRLVGFSASTSTECLPVSNRASLCRSRIWRAWCPRSRTSRRPRTTSTACTTGCCPGRRRNLKTCGGWLFNCCVVHLSYPLLTDDLLVLIRPANRAKTVSGVSKYLSCEKLNKCNFENLSEVNIIQLQPVGNKFDQ